MKVRLKITGDTREQAEFVMGSLLERLPAGVTVGTRDHSKGEAVIVIEPLELIKIMLQERLKQIDPRECTSVDWRVERSDGAAWEAPRVDEIEDPLRFTVTVNGDSAQLSELFPAAAESWPAGVLFRDGGSDYDGNYAMTVELLPRWLVERAVSDSIRLYAPALALSLGRVSAKPDVEPDLTSDASPESSEGAYPEGLPVVIEGFWAMFKGHGLDWECENPMTGAKGVGPTQRAAFEAMVAEVERRRNATG